MQGRVLLFEDMWAKKQCQYYKAAKMKNEAVGIAGKKGNGIFAYLVSFVAAVGGFLFGYDLNIIAGAQQYIREIFKLTPEAFGFTIASALIGCLVGPFIGSWACDKLGRKKTLIFAAALFGAGALGTALPNTITVFIIFRIVGGIGVGLASVASPMYIAEIAPKKIRGMLVTMNQLAIVIGSLASIVVSYLLAKYLPEATSWRWMFASMLVPVVAFMILLCGLPESPRWLAARHKYDDALRILTKFCGRSEAELEMQGIKNETVDKQEVAVALPEFFTPGIRVALLVGIVLSLMSQWTGWSMVAMYMPTIYTQAGITVRSEAIFWTIIPNLANLVYTIIAIYLVDRVGRRPLYLVCTLLMAVMMSVLGLVFVLGIKGWPVVVVLSLVGAPHAIAIGCAKLAGGFGNFPNAHTRQSCEYLHDFPVGGLFYRVFCCAAAV